MTGAPRSMYVTMAETLALVGRLPDVPPPIPRDPCACTCGAIRPRKPPVGLTYAITQGRYVKIGTTRDPGTLANRARALATRHGIMVRPADLDWRLPTAICWTGPTNVEHQLHDQFAEHHVAGEWFHATPVLACLEGAVM